MNSNEIFDKLKSEFGDDIISLTEEKNYDPYITVKRKNIKQICLFLRDIDGLNFDYLVNLTGMDWGKELGVVYHLYSISLKHRIVLKVFLSKENPVIPSVERCWKSANWHEREAWDMFGIQFENHPNHIRILCPYDWEGHPLRKDYVEQETYHGMRVPV